MDDVTSPATSAETLANRPRAPPLQAASDDLATQTRPRTVRMLTGRDIVGVTLDDVAHDEVCLGTAQQERDEDPIQQGQTVVTHRGSPPAIASSFGRRPFDIVRITSTERLSSTAPAGSRR